MNESPLFDEFSIFWAGCELELETCPEHFCVVGAPGSGKTVSMKLLMHSVLSKIKPESDRRAMIYDPKRDVMPFLTALRSPSPPLPGSESEPFKGLDPEVPVLLLNPFDKRGVPWDICKDIRTPSGAVELAALLVPESASENQSYFRDAPRDLIAEITTVFILKCRDSWTLRDLILALSSRERMLLIAAESPPIYARVSSYLTSGKNGDGAELLSSLNAFLFKFRPLASAWHKALLRQKRNKPGEAPQTFSIQEWAETSSIVCVATTKRER